mmetsp:Transcript_1781/g.5778  ORF Transcript_1781/g.5778 Transcript_1781/m.5778 type:complete len:376 (+) Transcript_1781:625-1752(+)
MATVGPGCHRRARQRREQKGFFLAACSRGCPIVAAVRQGESGGSLAVDVLASHIGVHLQHRERLHDLGIERIGRLEQVEQLAVVHLQEHAGDLAGHGRLLRLDQREKPLAQQLLLLLRRRRGQRCSVQLARHAHRHGLAGHAAHLHWAHGPARALPLAHAALGARPHHAAAAAHLLHAAAAAALLSLCAAAAGAALHAATAAATAPHGHGAVVVVGHLPHHHLARTRPHHHLLRVHEAARALRLRRHLSVKRHLVDRLVHLAGGDAAGVGHASAPCAAAGLVLLLQHVLALVLALRQRHVQRLVAEDVAVHLGHRLGRLLLHREADEAEAARDALVVDHHLGRGDVAKRHKRLPQPLVVDLVVEVLDVQVDPGEL